MDFRMRIGLGKHVAERKNEVVRVPMMVELASILIKRGIRALRISVQNPDHPLLWLYRMLSALLALALAQPQSRCIIESCVLSSAF